MLVMIDLDNTLLDRHAAVAAWSAEFASEHALPPGSADWIRAQDRDGYAERRIMDGRRLTHARHRRRLALRSQDGMAAPRQGVG